MPQKMRWKCSQSKYRSKVKTFNRGEMWDITLYRKYMHNECRRALFNVKKCDVDDARNFVVVDFFFRWFLWCSATWRKEHGKAFYYTKEKVKINVETVRHITRSRAWMMIIRPTHYAHGFTTARCFHSQ